MPERERIAQVIRGKACRRCREEKPIEEFGRDGFNPKRQRDWCRECVARAGRTLRLRSTESGRRVWATSGGMSPSAVGPATTSSPIHPERSWHVWTKPWNWGRP